jgi:hypothetical protein
MERERIEVHQKALSINLRKRKYGTFAEIGAGQEVVRWFFRVGAAAGTIAKSMSAYDMTVSDAIYGPCQRYVSRQRLLAMLDHEYPLLLDRLAAKRGAETEFFTFANTVSAMSYKGGSDCHGWMGIRFQTHPGSDSSDILIHVRMLDSSNPAQQEALGIIGVNLIYGAFNYHSTPERLMQSLLDGLTIDRIEVDMVKMVGPAFANVDHRLLSLMLVKLGLSNAAMFSATGEVLQPSEVLRKKPILVERGSFRPPTLANLDILESARRQFARNPKFEGEEPVTLMELTMKNLMVDGGEIDYADFLARADCLAATGATVLISNYFEFYRLAAYLSRFTTQPIGVAMGVPSLKELFEEKYYIHLEGGILESFGRLFKNDLKLFIYPYLDPSNGQLQSVQKWKPAPHLQNLYEHLVENSFIESLDFYDRDCLPIFSRDVLTKIRENDARWESMVPKEVAEIIKGRKLFGYG